MISRRKFLVLAGGSGGLALALGACGGESGAATDASGVGATNTETEQFGKGDIGILNYVLTLERLQVALYGDMIKSGLFKGAKLEMLRGFGGEEAEHASVLTAAVKQLGGVPVAKSNPNFSLGGTTSALKLAYTLETLSAAAYLGQIANVNSPAVLSSVLAVHSVEGRHAAALSTLTGDSMTPTGAFATPLDAETALNVAESYVVA